MRIGKRHKRKLNRRAVDQIRLLSPPEGEKTMEWAIKAIIKTALALLGISGILIAGSDGINFPAANFMGLLMTVLAAVIYSVGKKIRR